MEPNELEDENILTEGNIKHRHFVCPWKNMSEFNQVYDLLFTTESSEQRDQNWRVALKELDIWILRRGELCPAAVHATKVIIEALLKDNQYTIAENQIFYSNAFLRFMNYMSSVMHTPLTQGTMYDKAKELGMPSFLVDLRHICAHGEVMPSVRILYNAATCCLEWLHQSYWIKQKKIIRDISVKNITLIDTIVKCDMEFSTLLNVLDSALYVYTNNDDHTIKTAKRLLPKSRYLTLKNYCKEHKAIDVHFIRLILLELQNLMENDVKLRSSPTTFIEYLAKMYYFFHIIGDHNRNNDNFTKKLIEITQPLFRLMAMYNMLESFFKYIIDIIENSNVIRRKRISAAFWALCLAEGFQLAFRCRNMYKFKVEEENSIKEKTLDIYNIFETTDLVRELAFYCNDEKGRKILLLYDTMQRPWSWTFDRSFLQGRLTCINEHTIEIIKCLQTIIVPVLGYKEMGLINNLIDVYMNQEIHEIETVNNATDNKIYSNQDILELGAKKSSDIVEKISFVSNENSMGIWTLLDKNGENDWKKYPLGVIPWN